MNFCPSRGATRNTRPRLPQDPDRPHAGGEISIPNRSFSCFVSVKASDSESAAAEPMHESDLKNFPPPMAATEDPGSIWFLTF